MQTLVKCPKCGSNHWKILGKEKLGWFKTRIRIECVKCHSSAHMG